MTIAGRHRRRALTAALGVSVSLAACGSDGDQPAADPELPPTLVAPSGETEPPGSAPADTVPVDGGAPATASAGDDSSGGGLPPSDYLESYRLEDDAFGTMVTVTVDGSTRTIETNALPNHETGEFPNDDNPNSITAQDLTWVLPAEGVFTGAATEARVPGVAVNGIKFEPGTAETVDCASGETYRVEAIQDLVDLGLDVNNAHVQPNGEYHYHGVSPLLVDAYDTDADLVHVGFASDGFLIYYSKSGAYRPGYALRTEPRTGTGCELSLPGGTPFDLAGTAPDGAYESDWVFDAANGDLDACNGTTIGDEYVYLLTDTYPFIPRCLNGEFTDTAAGGDGGGGGGGPPPGGDPPPGDEPPPD